MKLKELDLQPNLTEFNVLSEFSTKMHHTKLLATKSPMDTNFYVYLEQDVPPYAAIVGVGDSETGDFKAVVTQYYYDIIGSFLSLIDTDDFQEKYPKHEKFKENEPIF